MFKTSMWRTWCHWVWGGKVCNIEYTIESAKLGEGVADVGMGNPRAPHPPSV